MSDLNEWIATGTIATVARKNYNDKPFIEVVLNSRNYKDETVQLPFSIWGGAVDKFTAQIGDMVVVKGEVRSKQSGQYLNTSLSVYSVEVLSSSGLEPAKESSTVDVNEIDLGEDILF